MKLRTYVSFEFDLLMSPDEPTPAGFPIAAFLTESLRDSGFDIDAPGNREDWAWEFACRLPNYRVDCILGEVDDGPRRWLVTTHLRRSLWDRLRGRRHFDQLRRFFETLDRIIKNDARFRTVRWYTEIGFQLDGGEIWGDSPCSPKDHGE